MNEKRQRRRVAFINDCRLKAGPDMFLISEIRDLSMDGLAVFTDWQPETGTIAGLELKLAVGRQRKTIKAQCQVCRHFEEDGKSGIGLKIVTISETDSITLFNIVKYQSGSVHKLLG